MKGKDIPNSWKLSAIRLGDWDTLEDPDCDDSFVEEKVCNDPAVDYLIESQIPHHNYDPYSLNNHYDIALLRLSSNVEYTHFISPICLPTDANLESLNYDKQTLSVAGWGITENGIYSTKKLKINIDGMSTNECQKLYVKENIEISDTQVCAGGQLGYDSW